MQYITTHSKPLRIETNGLFRLFAGWPQDEKSKAGPGSLRPEELPRMEERPWLTVGNLCTHMGFPCIVVIDSLPDCPTSFFCTNQTEVKHSFDLQGIYMSFRTQFASQHPS